VQTGLAAVVVVAEAAAQPVLAVGAGPAASAAHFGPAAMTVGLAAVAAAAVEAEARVDPTAWA